MIPFFIALIVLACYILINFIVFIIYAYDKHSASTDGWRIPEKLLIVAAIIGPFGAYAAMCLLRHKTRKIKFYLVPVFLAIHSAGILYIATIIFHP